mgnify:CR=1 FL=1
MARRTSEATWKGTLQDGTGKMQLGSGAFEGSYSFESRFENGAGTNPEELIAAAHAGCFSMALSHALEEAGYKPESIHTKAHVSIEKAGEGFQITTIELETEGNVPNIEAEAFEKQAEAAKEGCPVSQALAGAKIELSARLAG